MGSVQSILRRDLTFLLSLQGLLLPRTVRPIGMEDAKSDLDVSKVVDHSHPTSMDTWLVGKVPSVSLDLTKNSTAKQFTSYVSSTCS